VSRTSAIYAGGRATGSVAVSAALRPSLERPTPSRGRCARRIEIAFSSTASASTALRLAPRLRASLSSVARASLSALTVVRRFMMHDAIKLHPPRRGFVTVGFAECSARLVGDRQVKVDSLVEDARRVCAREGLANFLLEALTLVAQNAWGSERNRVQVADELLYLP
jgi:hypothetical protein